MRGLSETEKFMLLLVFLATSINVLGIRISDQDRRQGALERNYSWPINSMVPNDPGWDRVMRRRIRQVEAMPAFNDIEKYDAWNCAMEQALVLPNFTRYGWAVTKAPVDLVRELQRELHNNFHSSYPEGEDSAIVVDSRDLMQVMVDLPKNIYDKALHQLLPYHEAWAQVPLKPQAAYGLRVYHNTSRLYMHLDKIETHVISCIFHIDHSDDAQPWPLTIEDFSGTTQNVYLEKGDMLFYESAKCSHGRPVPFVGSWYTSLFMHYSPLDWPFERMDWGPQYAIPDHWQEVRPYRDDETQHWPQIQMIDTAIIEPECPHMWCQLEEAKSNYIEAEFGIAKSANGFVTKLELNRDDEL